MRLTAALALLLTAFACHAAPPVYDETADAKAAVRTALAAAAAARLPVLVVFGANWCPDCKLLDAAFKREPNASLIARSFNVVKVDVGRFDRNTDLAAAYGVPLKRGIPAVALLSPDGRVIYATQAGELADARNMSERGLYEFFARIAHDQR